jgi:hypothetical protein
LSWILENNEKSLQLKYRVLVENRITFEQNL